MEKKTYNNGISISLKGMNRRQLVSMVKQNNKEIERLKEQNIQCLRASYLLNDKKQSYHEEEFTVGRGKNKRTEVRGMVRWMQTFVDEGTGEEFQLERNNVVKIDGEWI